MSPRGGRTAPRSGATAARGQTWPSPGDPRFPDRPVWIQGRVCRGGEAAISVFDRGARDGLALIETVRVAARRPLRWQAHMERLVLAAAELGFPVPPAPSVLEEGLGELLEAAALDDAAARITVTRGVQGLRPGRPGCWIDAEPLAARLWRGVRRDAPAAIVSGHPFEPGPFGRYKTASRVAYAQAAEEARIAGADEALLCAADGELLEGAVSNVFVVRNGDASTPPLARGILPGVMRAAAIAACRRLGVPVREERLTREDLAAADEVFVTNALQGVVPLASLDGRGLARDLGARIREDAEREAR